MAFLADINFLVALLHEGHQHSSRASAWLERQQESGAVGLCRVAQMGVLRVLTNRSWLKSEVRTAAEVWGAWDMLFTDERFVFLMEPDQIGSRWRKLTERLTRGKMVDTDSYLAAFALTTTRDLLTFDEGLQRFDGLTVEIPD